MTDTTTVHLTTPRGTIVCSAPTSRPEEETSDINFTTCVECKRILERGTDPLTHARSQAAAQVASIVELYEAREKFEEGLDDVLVEVDGETFTDVDSIDYRACEIALEVLVRGDWTSIGSQEDMSTPYEFQILLCTGGPSVRLRGTLSDHAEPERVYVQCQDWGTPWTDTFHPDAGDALLWFAGLFYYGDS